MREDITNSPKCMMAISIETLNLKTSVYLAYSPLYKIYEQIVFKLGNVTYTVKRQTAEFRAPI